MLTYTQTYMKPALVPGLSANVLRKKKISSTKASSFHQKILSSNIIYMYLCFCGCDTNFFFLHTFHVFFDGKSFTIHFWCHFFHSSVQPIVFFWQWQRGKYTVGHSHNLPILLADIFFVLCIMHRNVNQLKDEYVVVDGHGDTNTDTHTHTYSRELIK